MGKKEIALQKIAAIKNATIVGENTAERVGDAMEAMMNAHEDYVKKEEFDESEANVGINALEICKLDSNTQMSGSGTVLTPSETQNGYYNVSTRQWVAEPTFTFRKFALQEGKYYTILVKTQGTSSVIASLVLFRGENPVHIYRYANNTTFAVQAKGIDAVGLTATTSSVTEYDSATENIPLADGSVTNAKLANFAVGTSKIQNNSITFDKIEFKSDVYGVNRADPDACTYGYIRKSDGVFVAEQTRMATDFIPVSRNGLYCNRPNGYGVIGGGAVYDASRQYLRGFAGNVNAYVYQDGDAYVRWTVSVDAVTPTTTLYVIEGTSPGTYVPYTPPTHVIKQEYIPVLGEENIANGAVTSQKLAPGISFPSSLPAISLCGKSAIKVTSSSIASGGTLQITDFPQYLKASGVVSFSAKLSSFNGLLVGFGDGGSNSIQVKVDATNVSVFKSGSAWSGLAWTHGLTISDFIIATFDNNLTSPSVTVATKSGIYVKQMSEFPSLESYGYPTAVLSSGTAATAAELRATSPKFSRPIWVIGDSYMSLYQERWTYQMIKTIGIDDFLIIGLAGGGSSGLFADLQKALNFGTPKFLLWCLGMNDSYSVWNTVIEQVKTLCTANGIELIMQTIPIPNLSTSSNQTQINSAVKASEYRYIDACAAMCPNNNWPWYDGYTTDGVHPTVLGAKVLASRFLSDFPEFMQ